MRSAWWVLVSLAMGVPLGTHGEVVSSARLQVSAVVLPRVRLQADDAPVRVTTADVVRGYVDVVRRYALRTNALERVVLQLQSRPGGCARAVAVDGLGPTLQLAGGEPELMRPAVRELDLAVRLWLADGIVPGEHEWPLHVAAVVD